MKIIGVGGAPASGKTALFKEIMTRTGGELKWRWAKKGLVVYHLHSKTKTIILGDYSQPGTFGGTDKLSMAVQEEALEFLKGLEGVPCVLFEGDRLWNAKFFESLISAELSLKLIEVAAKDSTLGKRHKERKDTQSEKWLTGRLTKLSRIRENFQVKSLPNNDRSELATIVDYLLRLSGLFKPAETKNS